MDKYTISELAYENGYAAAIERIKTFINAIKLMDGNSFVHSWYESADICFEFDNESYKKFINELIKEVGLFKETMEE